MLTGFFFLQNDDEDMVFMYRAYLHKLITSLLSQPVGRDKVFGLFYASSFRNLRDRQSMFDII